MAKKKSSPVPSLWDDAEEVPRSGLPDAEKLARRHKIGRRYISFTAITFPFMCFAMAVAFATLGDDIQAEPVSLSAPASKPVALAALDKWLTQSPGPAPGARLLTWDDYTVLPAAPVVPGQESVDAPELQSHHFTLRAKNGELLSVELLVAVAGDGQMTTIGIPSLVSAPPLTSTTLAATPVWPGMATDAVSEPVARAIEAWAAAFTGTDPVALRQVVGDPDTTHAYVPLWGLESSKATVVTSAWVMDNSGDEPVKSSSMIAEVSLELIWPGHDPKEDPARAAYDVLVVGADTAAPRIVAWGGAGTGPILKPYSNAVIGRDLTATNTPKVEETADAGAPAMTDDTPIAGE